MQEAKGRVMQRLPIDSNIWGPTCPRVCRQAWICRTRLYSPVASVVGTRQEVGKDFGLDH